MTEVLEAGVATKEVIRASYEKEQQRRHVATTLDDVPVNYDLIKPEWWSAILCAKHPGAKVTSFRAEAPDDLNRGHMRVYLEYNDAGRAAGLPPSVFCKDSQSLDVRMLNTQCGTIRGEIVFYNEIAKLTDLPTPQSLFSAYDHGTHNSIVVMRDLLLEDAEFCLPGTNMTRARAESQLAALAKLHGRFYGKTNDYAPIAGLKTLQQTARSYDAALNLSGVTHVGFLASKHVIPARLYKRDAEIWTKTMAAVDAYHANPVTLGHNDAHVKNWYITNKGDLALADWQAIARAHWSHDVTFTLSTSLNIENRRAWEQDLLQFYAEKLHAAGGPKLDKDEVFTAYRRNLFIALSWWTCCVKHDHSFDYHPMADTFDVISRTATAIDDLDAIDSFD